MRRDIIIADQFYRNPDEVVRHALSLDYVSPYNRRHDEAAGRPIAWRTSRFRNAQDCPFKSSAALRAKLEFLIGETIDLDFWNRDFPLDEHGYPLRDFEQMERGSRWNCAFNVKHCAQQMGEGVHNHTDADGWNSVTVDGWVGLIYLNKDGPLQAGLNTWTNVDPQRQFDWMTPAGNWRLVDTFGSVFNRLILHRGHLPHSGAAGWGTAIEDGRLFQTFFFRTRQTAEVAPLAMDALARVPA